MAVPETPNIYRRFPLPVVCRGDAVAKSFVLCVGCLSQAEASSIFLGPDASKSQRRPSAMHPGWISRVAHYGRGPLPVRPAPPELETAAPVTPPAFQNPELGEEEIALSQDLSDSISEAASRVFWARALVHHTQSLGYQAPTDPSMPIRVMSACTGSFAEAACFKDTGCSS